MVQCSFTFSKLLGMDPNETTVRVHWGENMYGGDSYYLQINHSCPCSNMTSGDACKWTLKPRLSLCIDLEDRLKALRPKGGTLRFDLGEVDLSAPWKYYRCPVAPSQCSP